MYAHMVVCTSQSRPHMYINPRAFALTIQSWSPGSSTSYSSTWVNNWWAWSLRYIAAHHTLLHTILLKIIAVVGAHDLTSLKRDRTQFGGSFLGLFQIWLSFCYFAHQWIIPALALASMGGFSWCGHCLWSVVVWPCPRSRLVLYLRSRRMTSLRPDQTGQ